jgi:hypothetical protein
VLSDSTLVNSTWDSCTDGDSDAVIFGSIVLTVESVLAAISDVTPAAAVATVGAVDADVIDTPSLTEACCGGCGFAVGARGVNLPPIGLVNAGLFEGIPSIVDAFGLTVLTPPPAAPPVAVVAAVVPAVTTSAATGDGASLLEVDCCDKFISVGLSSTDESADVAKSDIGWLSNISS